MLHLLSSLAGGEARQPARPDVGLAGKPGGESGSRIRHPRTEPVVQVSVRAAVSREGLLLAAMDVSHAGFIRPVKKPTKQKRNSSTGQGQCQILPLPTEQEHCRAPSPCLISDFDLCFRLRYGAEEPNSLMNLSAQLKEVKKRIFQWI